MIQSDRSQDASGARLEQLSAWTPWFIVIFAGCNLAIRLLVSSNLEPDEAGFVTTASFALGYPNSQPPLFHWIVDIFFAITGYWPAAIAIPKYIFLATTYLLTFDLVRRVTGRNLAGATAAAAIFLVPDIVYVSALTRVHSILTMCASVASLHAVVLIVQRPHALRFAWFGFTLSAGLLSKYNFIFVFAAVLAASAMTPMIRRVIFTPKLVVSIGIVLFAIAPHAVWAMNNMELVTTRMDKLARVNSKVAWLDLPSIGLDGLAVLSIKLFEWTCLLIVAWLLARFVAARAQSAKPSSNEFERAFARFFGLTIACSIGLFAVFVLVADVHSVRVYYITSLLMALPPWLALRWPIATSPTASRGFLTVAAGVAVIVTVAWPIQATTLSGPYNYPYGKVAPAIKVEPPFAVLSKKNLAANLVIRLPAASVWDRRTPANRVVVFWDGEIPARLIEELGPSYCAMEAAETAVFPSDAFAGKLHTYSWQVFERSGGGCP